jgi:CspA family cold shock protein
MEAPTLLLGSGSGWRRKSMPVGVVKWFSESRGYGFITPDGGGNDVFVHSTGIKGTGYQNLKEGQRVEFEIIQRSKGPQAENVTSSAGGSPQEEPQSAAPIERGGAPGYRSPAETASGDPAVVSGPTTEQTDRLGESPVG